jgi:uncharacterized membrane protein (UPF0136 family)
MVAGCAGGFCLGYLVAFTFRLYPSRKTSAVVLLVLLALVVVVYMYVNPARVK